MLAAPDLACLLDDLLGRLAGARDVAQHALDQVKVHAARHAHAQVQQRPAPRTPTSRRCWGPTVPALSLPCQACRPAHRACQQDHCIACICTTCGCMVQARTHAGACNIG